MKRFMVVGCGGSGGAVLSYLMDQLRSDLAAAGAATDGRASLPRGWQFVHIDVPLAPDTAPDGLGSARDQGGRYISTGPQTGSYEVVDQALTQRLLGNGALDAVATWAPRSPGDVKTPPSIGAGQYRAVGRMITLTRAADVLGGLQKAWSDLNKVEAATDMQDFAARMPSLGSFDAANRPIVLVVSSMAGGAGASMALDVCRLLRLVNGLDPNLMGVFMVGADVFDTLPTSARGGVRPNALAMLGEIVAAQSGSAGPHDTELLAALGHSAGDGAGVPFARVFPVSRFIGEGTMLGDGTPKAVYRGLGRGLAALMSSGAASDQFVHYDLGNTLSPSYNRSYFGWGPAKDTLHWGSFGYAALSMGRDRYAEYAAQRLARAAVDHLLTGHLSATSTASGSEQRDALVASQWQHSLGRLGLPATPPDPEAQFNAVGAWFTRSALPEPDVERSAVSIVEADVSPYIPTGEGTNAAQWLSAVNSQLAVRRSSVVDAANAQAYRWAHGWQEQLLQRTTEALDAAVATHGVPYAEGLVRAVRLHLENTVVPTVHELGRRAQIDVARVPENMATAVVAMKGPVIGAHKLVADLLTAVRRQTRDQLFQHASTLLEQVLRAYVTDVLAPMSDALGEAQRLLEQATSDSDPELGLARLTTDHYPGWPSERDGKVPDRFSHADNEILVTSPQVFPDQYQADVQAAARGDDMDVSPRFEEARTALVSQVVAGRWRTTGGTQPPGGLLELTSSWRSQVFPTEPGSGAPLVPSRARFDLHTRPVELLGRSRTFVGRPQESFRRFTSVSLRDYVEGEGAMESAKESRIAELISKFRQVLTLARPLAAVSPDAIMAIHGSPLSYRYKFSAVPFSNLSSNLDGQLRTVLSQLPSVDHSSVDNLDEALQSVDSLVTRVDVFGSYMNYSPLVFEGVLRPVAEQWGLTPVHGRQDFWRWRRARPLAAALPMSPQERRAMVAGWFVAQVVGDLRIPGEPFSDPVTIWDDDAKSWLGFPHPLLTPPTSPGFAPFDWLPAVLESVLLAYTRTHDSPVLSSLRPYAVLRAKFDDAALEPTSGMSTLAGKRRLEAWLQEGRSPSGGTSRIPDVGAALSVQGRQDAVRAWLAGPREIAAVHFMAPGQDGAPGGGEYSVINNRAKAATVPIFRDIAPDVLWACDQLLGFLDSDGPRWGQEQVF